MKIEKTILIVINGDATDPIVYSEAVPDCDFLTNAVVRACRELDLPLSDYEMEDVVSELNQGRVYWWHETYCFTKI